MKLLRNIDKYLELRNGIRLIVNQLTDKHTIEAKVISRNNNGQNVFIPKMVLTPSNS